MNTCLSRAQRWRIVKEDVLREDERMYNALKNECNEVFRLCQRRPKGFVLAGISFHVSHVTDRTGWEKTLEEYEELLSLLKTITNTQIREAVDSNL